MTATKAMIWDFDGVLNANIVDGRFIWTDHFDKDIRQCRQTFQSHIFSPAFEDVILGRVDLLDHLQSWADAVGYASPVQKVLDYWLQQDARPDAEAVALLDAMAARGIIQAIGTNNEHHRASYIESQMGFGTRISAMFASGRMGVAKPDPAYFARIEDELGIAPQQLLLIDDHGPNIEAATQRGWQAFHFTPGSHDRLRAYLGL